jgi:F-type H+-transporting ATPase subunit a
MFSRVSGYSKKNIFTLFFIFTAIFSLRAEHDIKAPETEAVKTEEHGDTASPNKEEEKFNAGKLIMEHIADAHEWHIIGHTAIPLPVILYSPTKGLQIFSSSRFEPHHAEERTYGDWVMKDNKITAEDNSKVYDLSITKNVVTLFTVCGLLLIIFLGIARSYQKREGKAPKGMQSLLEPFILFVRDDIAKSSIGEHKYRKFMPLLLTLFFFIWVSNLLGLIPIFPGGANLTGNIAVTMFLAVVVLIVVTVIANKNYWSHIVAMPGVPKAILILLTPIEILGFFLRPFVLMIRLFANILAGHIIALSFYSLIFIFGATSIATGYGVSIFAIAFNVFMFMMELLVGFLQAFVFTLLTAMYIGSAVEEPHHH